MASTILYGLLCTHSISSVSSLSADFRQPTHPGFEGRRILFLVSSISNRKFPVSCFPFLDFISTALLPSYICGPRASLYGGSPFFVSGFRPFFSVPVTLERRFSYKRHPYNSTIYYSYPKFASYRPFDLISVSRRCRQFVSAPRDCSS